jgi:hypothetical protein
MEYKVLNFLTGRFAFFFGFNLGQLPPPPPRPTKEGNKTLRNASNYSPRNTVSLFRRLESAPASLAEIKPPVIGRLLFML